jgi:hypothetical protein
MNTDKTGPTDPTDPRDRLPRVGEKEAKRIIGLLEAAIVKSRRSRREIERKLDWSQGYLGSLLRGRITLKVWHVFSLCHELGEDPLAFFLVVGPPRDPAWVLAQLGITPPPEPAVEVKEEEEEPPLTRDEVEELMRKLLHEELAKFGLLEPSPTN